MSPEFEATVFAAITLLTLGTQTGLGIFLYRRRFGSVTDQRTSRPAPALVIRKIFLIQIWFGLPATLLQFVLLVLSAALSLRNEVVQGLVWSVTILLASIFQLLASSEVATPTANGPINKSPYYKSLALDDATLWFAGAFAFVHSLVTIAAIAIRLSVPSCVVGIVRSLRYGGRLFSQERPRQQVFVLLLATYLVVVGLPWCYSLMAVRLALILVHHLILVTHRAWTFYDFDKELRLNRCSKVTSSTRSVQCTIDGTDDSC
ncbi:hypothetical protein B0T10DRAFT_582231 [Thelonectria olida]|uniref:Uncharacterized protein n=1 Tax=Thelonectria olida TaxID=1576542 RepID=A0A9P8VVK4_9HYPO|nr:hypothetical protein B0T10DRAFT_582231 [Thelonectria olida]